MARITIVALIYRSPVWAESVYSSLIRHTPHLSDGRANFFFVANDPTPDLLHFLQQNEYPHYVNVNPRRTDAELFQAGIAKPEYIHRVYRGWNYAIRMADGEIVVTVSSDMFFSPCWLDALLKYSHPTRIVSSQLVERHHPKHGIIPGAIRGEFGDYPTNFDEIGFLGFASMVMQRRCDYGGTYGPCLFYKEMALRAGLYPEGNLAGSSFNEVRRYGDQEFIRRLAEIGVEHVTAKDSIVYHTKEGEMDRV